MTPKKNQIALADKRSIREIERRRSNREAILYAAEAVICRKGMIEASMDDVAAEAGFSKATLYKYIRGKSELVFELLIHFVEDLDERLREIAAKPLKPEAKLLIFLREVLRYQAEKSNIGRAFLTEGSMFKVIHAMAGGNGKSGPEHGNRAYLQRLLAARKAVYTRLEAFLQEGISSGAFRPMPLGAGAGFLSAVIQGYQHDTYFRDSKPDFEKNVSDIYAFVLRGISSDKSAGF